LIIRSRVSMTKITLTYAVICSVKFMSD
jgi:hypothetical protein